tara:strand:+ start:2722 stop:2892 length:171 start_codon:yes stop_codon:yes gene_type:complete
MKNKRVEIQTDPKDKICKYCGKKMFNHKIKYCSDKCQRESYKLSTSGSTTRETEVL